MSRILKILIIVLFLPIIAQGQQLKVLITEEKQGKRVNIYAENKTTDSLNVFLTINAEGYRRSSLKPVTRDIAPLSKVLMTTLIELAGEESRYTFDLQINDREKAVELGYDQKERDIERVIRGKIVLFTAENCVKCDRLTAILAEERLAFRSFDIQKDRKLYGQFMSFIERKLTAETKIRFPVIWNRDEVLFGYDDLEGICRILTKK